MKNAQNFLKSSLTNKWTVITALSIITFFIVLTNLIINRSFIDKIMYIIEDELGNRLCIVSNKIAENIEYDILFGNIPSSFTNFFPSDISFLNTLLETEQQINDLQSLYIVDRDFHNIVSFPAIYKPGEIVSHLVADSVFFQLTLQDSVVASPMYEVSGNYFKTAYAPLKNDIGTIIGVVIVEASASQFNTIREFQRYMNVGLAFTFAIFGIAILFIYWIVSQFSQLQISAQRNERLASMGQMAATVAHEIRNPLGIIKSTAEVMKAQHAKAKLSDELLGFIPDEVDRLNRLITDFLTFARDRDLNLTQSNIAATIDKTLRELEHDFMGTNIELKLTTETTKIIINHDPDGIKQVLINLIQNAAQAMENDGIISVRIDVISNWNRHFVQISVTDNGPGISEPYKIFEPFYTTKTSGSGLGLAVTRQIIIKHGGKITAKNRDNAGAEFKISLPF